MPIPKTLPLLINILKGEHLEGYNENEILFFKTKKVTIECEDKLGTDIDGEKEPDFLQQNVLKMEYNFQDMNKNIKQGWYYGE